MSDVAEILGLQVRKHYVCIGRYDGVFDQEAWTGRAENDAAAVLLCEDEMRQKWIDEEGGDVPDFYIDFICASESSIAVTT